jgi:hypothetical protein
VVLSRLRTTEGPNNWKESYCRSLRDGLALDTAMKHNTAV